MRETRLMLTLSTLVLAMVQGYPDPQSRLVLRYNRYLGQPQSDFVYYNPHNTFHEPLNSYHEDDNPHTSHIVFKPLETDLNQQTKMGHNNLNKVTEEFEFNLDNLIKEKLADERKLTKGLSKVEDKINQDARKLEDTLTDEVNDFQNKLTSKVSKFDEEINGRETRNTETMENYGSSSIYFKDVRNMDNNEDVTYKEANYDMPIYFKDPATNDPNNMNLNVDTNFDYSPILFVEPKLNIDPVWPETTDSKYEIDSPPNNPTIKFENLMSGAPLEEERKGRTERAASYSTSATRWSNYYGNYGQESASYPRAHQRPDSYHSMERGYGSSGPRRTHYDETHDDSHEAQRETRGYMIDPYNSQHHKIPDGFHNMGYERHRGYSGNRQVGNVEFGGQKNYGGQQQIDNLGHENQEEYDGQEKMHQINLERYRGYNNPNINKQKESRREYEAKQRENVHIGEPKETHGQKQTDNIHFGVQREYSGQKQIHDEELDGQKEFEGQKQTDDNEYDNQSEYDGQKQTDNVEFDSQREHRGQQPTDNVDFGGQREYGSQKQTDDIEFGSQREYDGQKQTDDIEFGNQREHRGQQQTDNIQFGGQREYDGQKQTDDIEFGSQREYDGQKQTDKVEFDSQREHRGQQQTGDIEFGSHREHTDQQQTDSVEFGGQREYGHHLTGNAEFGEQREHSNQQPITDIQFGGQQQTDDVQFGGQKQADDVEFGGQKQTDDEFGGQQQTDDVQFGGQKQTDDVEFGGQQQTDDIQFGGQQQTDDVQFGGQKQTYDEFGGQQQTDDVQFGGQQQTDGVQFGGQKQTDDEFGGQKQTDDVQFGGQQQTDDVQFGGQKQTDNVEFGGQMEYDGRATAESVFGEQKVQDHMQPKYGKFGGLNKGSPQLLGSHIPDFSNQNQYQRTYVGQSHIKTNSQRQEGYKGSKQTDVPKYDNARRYVDPNHRGVQFERGPTVDALSVYGESEQANKMPFNNKKNVYQNNQRGYEHTGNMYLGSHGYYEDRDQQRHQFDPTSYSKTESRNLNINKDSKPSEASPSYQNPAGYSGSHQSFGSSRSFVYGSYNHGYSNQPQHTSGYSSHKYYTNPPVQRNNYRTSFASPTLSNHNHDQIIPGQEEVFMPTRIEMVEATTGRVNKYKKVENLLDDLEKDLSEQPTESSGKVFVPVVKTSSSAALTSSNRLMMESPDNSHITYTPYSVPSRPQFEYNSDEEEEKPSFWSNLGNKMKNTYNKAKDKTKQIITDVKEKITL